MNFITEFFYCKPLAFFKLFRNPRWIFYEKISTTNLIRAEDFISRHSRDSRFGHLEKLKFLEVTLHKAENLLSFHYELR